MFSGYAFAAIKKTSDSDYDPDAGPSGNGIRYDDPEDDTKPDVTYTITGQGPVLPYTPFTVTVTASDGKTAGTHGRLSGMFSDNTPLSYEVRSQSGWNLGANTYTLGVRSCDRSKSGVTFFWLMSGKDPSRFTLAYNVGHMVPNITSTNVRRSKTFTFTVKFCSSTGGSVVPNCYGNWGNFGASVRFEIWDGEKWTSSSLVTSRGITGSSGSFTGTGFCGNLDNHVTKIRVCVTYAGETLYDEADVADSMAVEFVECPSALHIYGEAAELELFAEDALLNDLPTISAEDINGDSVNIATFFEDGVGEALDFSTGWTNVTGGGIKWSGTIRAKSSIANTTTYYGIKLVATYGNVQSHAEINIFTALKGYISAPETIVQRIACNINLAVKGGVDGTFAIPRLPDEIDAELSLEADGLTVAEYSELTYNEGNGMCSCIANCTFSKTGINTLNFLLDDNLLEAEFVFVISIVSALVEAINERNLAIGHSGNDVNANDTINTIYVRAKQCIQGYISEIDYDTETVSTYNTTSANQYISSPSGMELEEWLEETYSKVCNVFLELKSYGEFDATDEGMRGIGTSNSYSGAPNPSDSQLRNAAYEDAVRNISSAGSLDHGDNPRCFTDMDYSGGKYTCTIVYNHVRYRLQSIPSVSCNVRLYATGCFMYYSDFTDGPNVVTQYDGRGFLDSTMKKFTFLGSFEQDSSNSWSQRFGTNNYPSYISSGSKGFYVSRYYFVADYNFKHK